MEFNLENGIDYYKKLFFCISFVTLAVETRRKKRESNLKNKAKIKNKLFWVFKQQTSNNILLN